MPDHHCHAPGCRTPCPPRLLMCPRCWALVAPEHQREVYRTVGLRGARIDGSWAPWWRAQAQACADVALAKGADPDRVAAKVAHDNAFADRLEKKP